MLTINFADFVAWFVKQVSNQIKTTNNYFVFEFYYANMINPIILTSKSVKDICDSIKTITIDNDILLKRLTIKTSPSSPSTSSTSSALITIKNNNITCSDDDFLFFRSLLLHLLVQIDKNNVLLKRFFGLFNFNNVDNILIEPSRESIISINIFQKSTKNQLGKGTILSKNDEIVHVFTPSTLTNLIIFYNKYCFINEKIVYHDNGVDFTCDSTCFVFKSDEKRLLVKNAQDFVVNYVYIEKIEIFPCPQTMIVENDTCRVNVKTNYIVKENKINNEKQLFKFENNMITLKKYTYLLDNNTQILSGCSDNKENLKITCNVPFEMFIFFK